MATRCTAKQLAEALVLWSIEYGGSPVLCAEVEDTENLKCLDLFISTLIVFRDGFRGFFLSSFDEHKQQFLFSKKNLIAYLKPRCLLLANGNQCFDLLLVCAFVSDAVFTLSTDNNCFHLSRVAGRLLTTVLEDGFSEAFQTDRGWEQLMSYCKLIHASVFPSKQNRPPHFRRQIDHEDSEKYCEDAHETEKAVDFNKEQGEDVLVESKDVYHQSKELGDMISPQQKPSHGTAENDSTVTFFFKENSCEDECVCDDATYWYFDDLCGRTIGHRIANDRKHLAQVLNLLRTFKQDFDPERVSSNKYDIHISDDEDIEKLEKHTSNVEGYTFQLSDNAVQFLTKEVCKKKNDELDGDASEKQVLPQDITKDDIWEHFNNILAENEDEPDCELCKGKMLTFKKNYQKSFRGKYSNTDIVSDYIDMF